MSSDPPPNSSKFTVSEKIRAIRGMAKPRENDLPFKDWFRAFKQEERKLEEAKEQRMGIIPRG